MNLRDMVAQGMTDGWRDLLDDWIHEKLDTWPGGYPVRNSAEQERIYGSLDRQVAMSVRRILLREEQAAQAQQQPSPAKPGL
jgi:hypothetical protein